MISGLPWLATLSLLMEFYNMRRDSSIVDLLFIIVSSYILFLFFLGSYPFKLPFYCTG